MSISVAWELPRIVYGEVGGPETLQLFGSGSDAPAHTKFYHSRFLKKAKASEVEL